MHNKQRRCSVGRPYSKELFSMADLNQYSGTIKTTRARRAGRFLAKQGTTEFEQHPHNICQGLWGEHVWVWFHLPLDQHQAGFSAALEDLWRASPFCTEIEGAHGGNPQLTFNTHLGAGYHQCKVARRGKTNSTMFDVSVEKGGVRHTNSPSHLSSFDIQLENGFNSCFIGTRNTEHCKQNITCSFDPRSLTCLTCKSEHPVLDAKGGTTHQSPLSCLTSHFRQPWKWGRGEIAYGFYALRMACLANWSVWH